MTSTNGNSSNLRIRILFGLAVGFLLCFYSFSSPRTPSTKRLSQLPPTLAVLNSNTSPTYSSHICTGESITDPGQDTTRCHFRNVCLRLEDQLGDDYDFRHPDQHNRIRKQSSVTLNYYRPSAAREAPLYWYSEFPLATGASWVKIGRASSLTPDIVYNPIPTTALWSPTLTTVLTEAFWPENFGHALGDDFLRIYRLIKSFGSFSSNIGVIFHPACSDRGMPERGCPNHQKISKLLFERPLESASTPLLKSGEQVCFQNLLVGTRNLGMSTPSEGAWEPFLNQLKFNVDLDPYQLPKKQKIQLFFKTGRRKILNYPELKEHLEKRFEVEVEIINPAEYTLEEQIKLLQDTTVVISPCGGISFSSVFLPKGASAVFLDYWESRWNGTAQMERHIYSSVSTMASYYYPLEYSDLSYEWDKIPEQHRNLTGSEFWRSWVDVTVNLERMETYCLAALMQAEGAMGLTKSFKLD